MDLIAYAPQSKVLTSTGTAVSTLLPLDQNSGYPKEVRITATAPCYVELGDIGVTAVVGDALVQPRDPLVVATCGARSISVISVSGTASITVTALESGSVQSALTSPSLSLDMLSGVLSSAVTFTRASSGTYFDSTGRLVTASNDAPRFDYDPATLLPRGLLIEEQRTNLLLQSRDMTQAAWGKTDTTPTRNQVGIDGTANSATLLTEGSAGTASTAQLGAAVTAGSTLTGSMVVKKSGHGFVMVFTSETTAVDGAYAIFDLTNGLVSATTNVGAGTASSAAITNLGGGWYRCTVTCLPNGTYTVPRLQIRSATSLASNTRVPNATYIVDCAQLEVGSFATSVITTGAATVTRAADSASMTGTNFSSWFNASAGTFVVEGSRSTSVGFGAQAAIDDGTTANEIYVISNNPGFSGTTAQANVTAASVGNGANSTIGGVSVGSTAKMALAYAAGNIGFTAQGAAVSSVAGNVPSGLNRMTIGLRSSTILLNGYVRRLTYYPTRLSNATLQALTL